MTSVPSHPVEIVNVARQEEKWDLAITFFEKVLAMDEPPDDEDYSRAGAKAWIGDCRARKA